MEERIDSIITKLKGVSGQLAMINSYCEDQEFADAVYGTRDYLESIIDELTEIQNRQ